MKLTKSVVEGLPAPAQGYNLHWHGELMYRLMSAAHRLRLAVNEIESAECLRGEHNPAVFVLQEAERKRSTNSSRRLREEKTS